MKIRGFEIAHGWEDCGIELPRRSTAQAAAYDIAAAEDTLVPVFHPGVPPTLIPTGLKAYCAPDECFFVFNRSSGASKGLVLANGVGIIDADYYSNPKNDGHFYVVVFNVTDHDLEVKKGDRIAQIVFQKFLLIDDDVAGGERHGGFGSTDVKTIKTIDKNGKVRYNRGIDPAKGKVSMPENQLKTPGRHQKGGKNGQK